MTDRMPETPLRFEVAVGTVVAHYVHIFIILKALEGSKVRVRDVATAAELDVSVTELTGISGSPTPAEVKRRSEQLRQCTRKEWRIARCRERVIHRLLTDEGSANDRVTQAARALHLSRSAIYRLLHRYREAALTSSLLLGHPGITTHHRRLSSAREALVTRAIEERFLRRPRACVSQLTKMIRELCQRSQQMPVSRKAIERRIAARSMHAWRSFPG